MSASAAAFAESGHRGPPHAGVTEPVRGTGAGPSTPFGLTQKRRVDPARRFGSRLRYRSQLRGYDGSKLVSQGKTVVVTMVDRLNLIGYLAHPAHRQLLTKSLFHHNLVRLEAVCFVSTLSARVVRKWPDPHSRDA